MFFATICSHWGCKCACLSICVHENHYRDIKMAICNHQTDCLGHASDVEIASYEKSQMYFTTLLSLYISL